MKRNLLIALNLFLAIGLSVLAFNILPYANAVGCDAKEIGGKVCNELSKSELILTTIFPIIAISATVLISLKVYKSRPKVSLFLLVIWPLIIFGQAANVTISKL